MSNALKSASHLHFAIRGTCAVAVGLVLAVGALQGNDAGLALLPSSVQLSSREAQQTMVAQRTRAEQFEGQAVTEVEWVSSDQAVATIDDGVVLPVANGTARITAKFDGQTATADVTVT